MEVSPNTNFSDVFDLKKTVADNQFGEIVKEN
jgi:hypothetical protein